MKEPLIYISCSYNSANSWVRERSIREAEYESYLTWQNGAIAICPYLTTKFFYDLFPEETIFNGFIEIMLRCDAVYMCNYWEGFKESTTERKIALEHRIPVLYNLEDRKSFISTWNPPTDLV